MKKIPFAFIIFCSTLLLLAACSLPAYSTDSATVPTGADNTDITTESGDDGLYGGRIYTEFVSESQAEFYEMIRENPIDHDYCNEVTDSTTLALRDIENKYAQIWLQELEFSCDTLLSVLDEEEKASFTQMNDAWELALQKDMEFVRGFQENHAFGSIFPIERASYYHAAIREHTLYVKYLLFLQGGTVVFQYICKAE